jgi:hypothetical protein
MKNAFLLVLLVAIAGCNFKQRDPLTNHPNAKKAKPDDGTFRPTSVPERIVYVPQPTPVDRPVYVASDPEVVERIEYVYKEAPQNWTASQIFALEIPKNRSTGELRFIIETETGHTLRVRNLLLGQAKISVEADSLPAAAQLVESSRNEAASEYELKWRPPANAINDPSLAEDRTRHSVTVVIEALNFVDKNKEDQVRRALDTIGCSREVNPEKFRCKREFDIVVNRSRDIPKVLQIEGLPEGGSVQENTRYPLTVTLSAPGTYPGLQSEPEVQMNIDTSPTASRTQFGGEFLVIDKDKPKTYDPDSKTWKIYLMLDTGRSLVIPSSFKQGRFVEDPTLTLVPYHVVLSVNVPLNSTTSRPSPLRFNIVRQIPSPAPAPTTAPAPAPAPGPVQEVSNPASEPAVQSTPDPNPPNSAAPAVTPKPSPPKKQRAKPKPAPVIPPDAPAAEYRPNTPQQDSNPLGRSAVPSSEAKP